MATVTETPHERAAHGKLHARARLLSNQRLASQTHLQQRGVKSTISTTKGAWRDNFQHQGPSNFPTFKEISRRMKPSKEELLKWGNAQAKAASQHTNKSNSQTSDENVSELKSAQIQAVQRERERRVSRAIEASRNERKLSNKQIKTKKNTNKAAETNLEVFKKQAIEKEKELQRKRDKQAALAAKHTRLQSTKLAVKARSKQLDVQLWRDEAVNREQARMARQQNTQPEKFQRNGNHKVSNNAKFVMKFMCDCMQTMSISYGTPQVPLDDLVNVLHDVVDGHRLPLVRSDWVEHVPIWNESISESDTVDVDEKMVDCDMFVEWVQRGGFMEGGGRNENNNNNNNNRHNVENDTEVSSDYMKWLQMPSETRQQQQQTYKQQHENNTYLPSQLQMQQTHKQQHWQLSYDSNSNLNASWRETKEDHMPSIPAKQNRQRFMDKEGDTSIPTTVGFSNEIHDNVAHRNDFIKPKDANNSRKFRQNERSNGGGVTMENHKAVANTVISTNDNRGCLEQRLGYLSTELEKILKNAKESEVKTTNALQHNQPPSAQHTQTRSINISYDTEKEVEVEDEEEEEEEALVRNELNFPVILYSGRCWLACQQRGEAWKAGVRRAREWEDYPDVCAEVLVEGRPHCLHVLIVIIKLGVESSCEISREDLENFMSKQGDDAVVRDWLSSGFICSVTKLMSWLINRLVVQLEDNAEEEDRDNRRGSLAASHRAGSIVPTSTSSGIAPPWVHLVFAREAADTSPVPDRNDSAPTTGTLAIGAGDISHIRRNEECRRRDVVIGCNEAKVQAGQLDTTKSVEWVPLARSVDLSSVEQLEMFADFENNRVIHNMRVTNSDVWNKIDMSTGVSPPYVAVMQRLRQEFEGRVMVIEPHLLFRALDNVESGQIAKSQLDVWMSTLFPGVWTSEERDDMVKVIFRTRADLSGKIEYASLLWDLVNVEQRLVEPLQKKYGNANCELDSDTQGKYSDSPQCREYLGSDVVAERGQQHGYFSSSCANSLMYQDLRAEQQPRSLPNWIVELEKLFSKNEKETKDEKMKNNNKKKRNTGKVNANGFGIAMRDSELVLERWELWALMAEFDREREGSFVYKDLIDYLLRYQ